MANGITSNKPRGFLRFLLRLPILLYRFKFGWLMTNRFLMLTHIGRKSGKSRRVILEVVSHDNLTGAYFIAAGWRGNADWFKNIQANPSVQFTVRNQIIQAKAQIVQLSEATDIFLVYAKHYPYAFQELSHMMTGESLYPNEGDCRQLAQSIPLVKLLPLSTLESGFTV